MLFLSQYSLIHVKLIWWAWCLTLKAITVMVNGVLVGHLFGEPSWSCGSNQAGAGLEEVAEHHQGLFRAVSRQRKVRLLEGYCPLQDAMDFSAVVLC